MDNRTPKDAAQLDYKQLGLRLKAARTRAGLTQEELADRVGCSVGHISNTENNRTRLALEKWFQIGNELGTGIDYFVMDQYSTSAHVLEHHIIMDIENLSREKQLLAYRLIRALAETDEV